MFGDELIDKILVLLIIVAFALLVIIRPFSPTTSEEDFMGRLIEFLIIVPIGYSGWWSSRHEKNPLGTKSEWMKIGLTALGMFIIILSAFFVPIGLPLSDYTMLIVLLTIPMWIIFVWVLMPKLLIKKKR